MNSCTNLQVLMSGISGRRPRSAYELIPPVVPFHKSDKFKYGGYTTSYQPYVPYRYCQNNSLYSLLVNKINAHC